MRIGDSYMKCYVKAGSGNAKAVLNTIHSDWNEIPEMFERINDIILRGESSFKGMNFDQVKQLKTDAMNIFYALGEFISHYEDAQKVMS